MADFSSEDKLKRNSIKRRFRVFSVFLFLVLFIGGSMAFVFSMMQIAIDNIGKELEQMAEIQRITLESSVNAEIAIALKMADSPLIQNYFMNPYDPVLSAIAFEEIAGYRRAFAGNTVFWVSDIDHRFYSDDAYAFTIDIDDPNNYWYYMTMYETEKYNFNINYNPDLNVTNLWINAPVFDSRGRPIGILGTGIDLTAFIDSIYREYHGSARLYFINVDGEITGAREASLVADKVNILNYLSDIGSEILSWINNFPNRTQLFSSDEGEVVVDPVPALGWYVVMIQRLTIGDFLNNSMTVLFLAMMSLIMLIFIIFNLFINVFINPMNNMISTLNQIAQDWDLTRRLNIKRKDEIGTLSDFFNFTFEKIRELLFGIKGMIHSLSVTGNELNANMEETGSTIEMINNVINAMRKNIISQSDEVKSVSSSIDNINGSLNVLNEHIVKQGKHVSESSSAIEQMLANINSVTQTLVKNSENINSLTESSSSSFVDLQKVSGDIQEIAKESESLLEINTVMQSIASQTNLLSMNAAIEAAHAGESGKGFAVVADEIRKLAENSGKQSKTISIVLKKIKTSIDMITQSTTAVLERFKIIEQEVETVSNQENQIRHAMEEQGTGSRHILEAITQLKTVTDLVQSASADMTTETTQIIKQSSNLKGITTEVTGSMDHMSESIEQIFSIAGRVKEISLENKHNITDLNGEISKFKVG